jgi:hypothetical protein
MKFFFLLGSIYLFAFPGGLSFRYPQPYPEFFSGLVAGRNHPAPGAAGSTGDTAVLGVFVASSPCDAAIRPHSGIPLQVNCELIQWQLTLFQHPQTKRPTRYKLKWAYGMSQPNTTGLKGGGTKRERTGNWVMGKGSQADPAAEVLLLDPDKPTTSIALLKLEDRLLHVLDDERALMIGNGAWSYTLNRSGN